MTLSPADLLRAEIAAMPGAVQVAFGSLTTPGLLDFNGQPWGAEGQAQIGGEQISLTYVYPDLPGLGPESEIVADGVAYVVTTAPRRSGDGLQAHVLLEAR
jgi:hypothetical protein